MLSLEQLQDLAQLVDSMEESTRDLEKFYANRNGEEFNKAKNKILESQTKISKIII